MRSGEAHCDQELADEVRRGRRRKKEEEEGRRKKEGRRSATNIKSNNPHLAGGEKKTWGLNSHICAGHWSHPGLNSTAGAHLQLVLSCSLQAPNRTPIPVD